MSRGADARSRGDIFFHPIHLKLYTYYWRANFLGMARLLDPTAKKKKGQKTKAGERPRFEDGFPLGLRWFVLREMLPIAAAATASFFPSLFKSRRLSDLKQKIEFWSM